MIRLADVWIVILFSPSLSFVTCRYNLAYVSIYYDIRAPDNALDIRKFPTMYSSSSVVLNRQLQEMLH